MSRTKKEAPPKDETASMFAAFEQAAGAAGLTCEPGKSAVDKRYRPLVDAKQAKTRFTGSVDLDAAFSVNQGLAPYHWLATAHVAMRAGSREAHLLAKHGLRLPSSKVVIG